MREAQVTARSQAHQIEKAFARSGVRESSLTALPTDVPAELRESPHGPVVAALGFCFEARARVLLALIDEDVDNFAWSELAPSDEDCAQIAVRAGRDAWGGLWPSLWTEWSALAVRHDHVRAHRSGLEQRWAARLGHRWHEDVGARPALADHLAWLSLASQALPGLETSGAVGAFIGRVMKTRLLDPLNSQASLVPAWL